MVEALRDPVIIGRDLSPDDLTGFEFDERTHTWVLQTRGEDLCARVVVDRSGKLLRPNPIRPYLGVAVHGFPNWFVHTGPDHESQWRYIRDCLDLMTRSDSSRMEVRRSSQQVFNEKTSSTHAINWRRMRKHIRSAFDLTSWAGLDDEVYDGPATLRVDGAEHPVRVRLTGHLDPIDGRYHWQGMIFDQLPDEVASLPQSVELVIGGVSAAARVTERTPWGSHAVVGVGAPPFPRAALEVTVPVL
jgi:hypothetical protein